MRLNKNCLKIDKPNAIAMINGFQKDGKLIHQSIWLAVKDRPKPPEPPELLTFNRSRTQFSPSLSRIGKGLKAEENFAIPFKYIAKLDEQYFVRNEMTLWEEICSNGLFDIWDPEGPYKRFKNAKSDKKKFRIQLLRIYNIDYEFHKNEIEPANNRLDRLIQPSREANEGDAVIPDGDFFKLKDKLERSIVPYRFYPQIR